VYTFTKLHDIGASLKSVSVSVSVIIWSSVTSLRLRLCLSVRAVKEKRLDLLTVNLVLIYTMARPRHCTDPEIKRFKVTFAAGVGLQVNITALVR